MTKENSALEALLAVEVADWKHAVEYHKKENEAALADSTPVCDQVGDDKVYACEFECKWHESADDSTPGKATEPSTPVEPCMTTIKPVYGAGYGAPNMEGCGLPVGHEGDHVGERQLARDSTPVEQRCDVRAEVMEFAYAMEEVLKRNDFKGGWHNMTVSDLYKRYQEEDVELRLEMIDPGSSNFDRSKEVIDVANFCMMLWHKFQPPATKAATPEGKVLPLRAVTCSIIRTIYHQGVHAEGLDCVSPVAVTIEPTEPATGGE